MRKREIKAALRKARKLIEAGWTRGSYQRIRDGEPCYCSIGAICMAVTGSAVQEWDSPSEAVLDAFRSLVPFGHIATWNDEAGRTQAEVLAMFDKAIAA